MEEQILNFITQIRNFVWGLPLVMLLVGTGIFLTVLWVTDRQPQRLLNL